MTFSERRFHPLEEVSEDVGVVPGAAKAAVFPSLRGSFGRRAAKGGGWVHFGFPSLRGSFGSCQIYRNRRTSNKFPSLRGSFGSLQGPPDDPANVLFPSLRGSFGRPLRLHVPHAVALFPSLRGSFGRGVAAAVHLGLVEEFPSLRGSFGSRSSQNARRRNWRFHPLEEVSEVRSWNPSPGTICSFHPLEEVSEVWHGLDGVEDQKPFPSLRGSFGSLKWLKNCKNLTNVSIP